MEKKETKLDKEEKTLFEILREVNVTGHVEQKNGLNYLSWAWAWDEIMKACPEAIYEIERFDNKPYLYDEKTGYMVFTKMNINGTEREMWLPVMDGNNKAMLDHEYTYKVKEYVNGQATGKYIDKKVEVATMFDVNKTIMRCLVKNLAMYGLGLALYSGEDLPETEEQLLEKAKKYKFSERTKVPNKTILEVYEENPKYLQWCLDNGKSEEVKGYIEMLTDLKRTYVPQTEEEQKRRLELINQIVEEHGQKDLEQLKEDHHVQELWQLTTEEMEAIVKK